LRSGEIELFDNSVKACESYGFYSGERIKVKGNKQAWVIGVKKNPFEAENLYIHIDGERGASYYSDFNSYEKFMKAGFELVSPRIVIPPTKLVHEQQTFKEQYFKMHNAPSLKTLLKDTQFSDVSFQVGNCTLTAHRNILSARCDYFRAMFQNGMKEAGQQIINIKNIDADTFRQVLEFLYVGRIQVDSSNIVSLASAAQLFQLDDLRVLICQHFNSVVTIDNVIHLLVATEMDKEMKDLCKKYILEHYDDVSRSDHFVDLISAENRNLVLEIMQNLVPTKKRKMETTGGLGPGGVNGVLFSNINTTTNSTNNGGRSGSNSNNSSPIRNNNSPPNKRGPH